MPDFHLRDLTKTQWWLLLGTLGMSAGFALLFFIEGNYEFLGYFSFLVFFIFFILITLKETRLPNSLLLALSLWSLMHMAGGSIQVGDGRLYELLIIPLYQGGDELVFFKYDQLVHTFGTGVLAAALHWAIRIHSPKIKYVWRAAFAALGAMGLGTFNEMIEFAAVLLLANTGVGGYINNQLDLFFNAIGAVTMVIGIELFLRLKNRRR